MALAAACIGCEEVRTVSLGREDGVFPAWYQDTMSQLPASYATDELPDGRFLVESAGGAVVIAVDTLPDGSRDVAFTREAFLLDGPTAAWYRDAFGADTILGIQGLDLELIQLDVGDVDRDLVGRPVLAAAGRSLASVGDRISLGDDMVAMLRERLLAGEEIRIPFALGFHLSPQALDALPSELHLFVVMQPTLYVDAMSAL